MPTLTVIRPGFVARVDGVHLARELAAADVAFLCGAFQAHPVLFFHKQPLTQDEQLAFAAYWGEIEPPVSPYIYNRDNKRRLKHELSDISNLDEDGKLIGKTDNRRLVNLANQLWHTDSTFKRTPAKMSMLSAQTVTPVGGETEFADMRAAWDALPVERQTTLLDLVARHDYFHSRLQVGLDPTTISPERRGLLPQVPQVLVRTDPQTGRHSLYLASHIAGIYGMDDAQAKPLVASLMAHATQDRFVYQHRWAVDDVVMWDNRYTMHRGRPFEDSSVREMRRATVMDDGPTVPVEKEMAVSA